MTTAPAHPAVWDVPDPVPGYRLHERRADVGMGEIWEATAPDGSRVLVRPVHLPRDRMHRDRAVRMAGVLPGLTGAGLDQVLDVIETPDGLALVRALPDGGTTLAALLRRRRTLTPAEICGMGQALGDAFGILHAAGVTHGRFQPADVLVASAGTVRLTGFGVAGVQGASGLPGDDVGSLADLLLTVLPRAGGTARLSAVLADMLALPPRERPPAAEFACTFGEICPAAPLRLVPEPGPRRGPGSAGRPVGGRAGQARSGATPAGAAPPPTLDAAVRALRSGARAAGRRTARGTGTGTGTGTETGAVALARIGAGAGGGGGGGGGGGAFGRPGSGARRRALHGRGASDRQPSWRGQAAGHAQRRRRGRPVGRVRLGSDRPARRRSPRAMQRHWRSAAVAGVVVIAAVLTGWRLAAPAPEGSRVAPARAASGVRPPDLETVRRLDAARAAAFSAGSVDGLLAADAAGSPAYDEDRRAMALMRSRGGRARGLTPRLFSVTELPPPPSQSPGLVVLRVVDEVPPYDFTGADGAVVARSPGHPRQAHDVAFILVAGAWRFVDSAAPRTTVR